MGMDLSKYKLENKEESNITMKIEDIREILFQEKEKINYSEEYENYFYFGQNLNDIDIENLIGKFEIIKYKYIDFEKDFIPLVSKLINKEVNFKNIDEYITWNLEKDDESFFIELKEEVMKELMSMLKDIEDEYDKKDSDKFSVEKLQKKLSQKIEDIENDEIGLYGKKFYLKDYKDEFNYSFEYYLKNIIGIELDYMRKPFKHYDDSHDNVISIGNFNGVDRLKIDDVFNKFIYSSSTLFITEKHSMKDIKELASFMLKENKKYFLKMFPLKENEMIYINW